MATRKIIESDLSGKTGAATVTFGMDGTWYEIDLTDAERKALEKAMADYRTKGRKTRRTVSPAVPQTSAEEREEIRTWGRENGFEFNKVGRIPRRVQLAYDEAHNIKRELPDSYDD